MSLSYSLRYPFINIYDSFLLKLPGGIFFGIANGLLWAILIIPSKTIIIPFQNKKNFLKRLDVNIKQIGYFLYKKSKDKITYCSVKKSRLIQRGITIKIKENQAKITGIIKHIEELELNIKNN